MEPLTLTEWAKGWGKAKRNQFAIQGHYAFWEYLSFGIRLVISWGRTY